MRRTQADERGVVAIMFALITCFILFGVAALVVDLGLARDTKQASQIASDASALAAANVLYPTSGVCKVPVGSSAPCLQDAVAAAKEYAEANYNVTAADWSKCTAPPSGFTAPVSTLKCVSFDSVTKPTKVWAVMPVREVKTGFGVMAGVTSVPVAGSARATLAQAVDLKCGLCFLGNIDSGNADYTVTGGGTIAINGNVDLGATGNMTVDAPGKVGITGTYDAKDGFHPGAAAVSPFPDPLSTLSLPVGNAGLTPKTNPCETSPKKGPNVPGQGPGVYGDVALDGACNLEPGLYIITGTWSLKNGDLLNNKPGGVTLYFTCGTATQAQACPSSGAPGGQLFGKNGDTNLTASPGGAIPGFAIVYDRHNTSSLQLQGNGAATVDGGIYAASASLEFNGTSDFIINRGPVVANGVIKANGTHSSVTVTNSTGIKIDQPPQSPALDR